MNDEVYMKLALEEARQAKLLDEVPIGAVIVRDDKVIARAFNRKSIYHAEVLVINQACKNLNSWYLDDCTLYTTVEPCMMCTGAIIQSRIGRVVYGTLNDSFGYLSKIDDIKINVTGDVLKKECAELLSDFFRSKR